MRGKSQISALSFAIVAAFAVAFGGCGERRPPYVPGLSDIMIANQVRHAKLWFAGQAENWPLASYEVDEIEEGFEAVVTYHPTHEESPVSLAETTPILTEKPVAALRSAIAKQSATEFTEAFDSLTKACNACHQATNYGFNVVTRPTGNWFLNQDFAP